MSGSSRRSIVDGRNPRYTGTEDVLASRSHEPGQRIVRQESVVVLSQRSVAGHWSSRRITCGRRRAGVTVRPFVPALRTVARRWELLDVRYDAAERGKTVAWANRILPRGTGTAVSAVVRS